MRKPKYQSFLSFFYTKMCHDAEICFHVGMDPIHPSCRTPRLPMTWQDRKPNINAHGLWGARYCGLSTKMVKSLQWIMELVKTINVIWMVLWINRKSIRYSCFECLVNLARSQLLPYRTVQSNNGTCAMFYINGHSFRTNHCKTSIFVDWLHSRSFAISRSSTKLHLFHCFQFKSQ